MEELTVKEGIQKVQLFNNPEFGDVRTMMIDGKPWFVANDIAKALGYLRPADAVSAHCKGSVKYRLLTNGGYQEVKIIPEGDLYRLASKSQLPDAEKFESWIYDEVLPTIREHGAYMTPTTIQQLLLNPDMIIQLATELKEAQAKNAVMKPKADYFDALVDKNLNTNFRDTAKELGVKEKEFIQWLLDKKYCYRGTTDRKLHAYAEFCESGEGMFVVKDTHNSNTAWAGTQTLITPKGKETFRLLIGGLN